MHNKSRYKKIQGMTIAVVLLVIMVVLAVGLAIAVVGVGNLNFAGKDRYNVSANYAAEAGLARALDKLNSDRAWDGSTYSGGTSTRTFENVQMPDKQCFYTVYVTNNLSGTSAVTNTETGISVPAQTCFIMCEGKAVDTTNPKATKKVGIIMKKSSAFDYAMFSKDQLAYAGSHNIRAYDSTIGTGAYDDAAAQKPGEADVATNGALLVGGTSTADIIIDGSSNTISGDVSLGPGASWSDSDFIDPITFTPSDGGEKKVLPAPISMPSIPLPTGAVDRSWPTGSGTADIILTPGSKDAPSKYPPISAAANKTYVLRGNGGSPGYYAFDGITMSGQTQIVVDDSQGPVVIYCNGNIDLTGGGGANFSRKDNGTVYKPGDLKIIGTPNCTDIKIGGGHAFCSVLYAPDAMVDLEGHGSSAILGCVVGKQLDFTGGGDFKYDVSLRGDMSIFYLVTGSYMRF